MKFRLINCSYLAAVFIAACQFSLAQEPENNAPYPSDRKLEIVEMPLPIIPDEVRSMSIQGSILLRVTFLSTGDIGEVSLLREFPYLGNPAIDAAKKIKFISEIRNGISTTITKTVVYTFDWENGWQNQLNKRARILKIPKSAPLLTSSDRKTRSCLVFLQVEFLDSMKIGEVSVYENYCKDVSYETAAIKLSKMIEFEPAIRENIPIKDVKLVTIEFEKQFEEEEYEDQ